MDLKTLITGGVAVLGLLLPMINHDMQLTTVDSNTLVDAIGGLVSVISSVLAARAHGAAVTTALNTPAPK